MVQHKAISIQGMATRRTTSTNNGNKSKSRERSNKRMADCSTVCFFRCKAFSVMLRVIDLFKSLIISFL